MSEKEREVVGPRRLQRAETLRSLWCFTIPEDTPIEHTFTVEFWRRCSEQLKAGDRIEVMSADRKTQFEIFVLDSNCQADPPRVDLVFRAIYPPDMKVPNPIVEASRWIVKQRQTDGLFLVYDKTKDEVIAAGLRREAAMQQVALLEKLARETASAKAA